VKRSSSVTAKKRSGIPEGSAFTFEHKLPTHRVSIAHRERISENQQIGGNWTPSFYGYDGHGNVRFVSSSAGTITDKYQYDAFGMLVASTGTAANDFRYSGERLHSSVGLYDLRARYYNQATRRFWARDPEEGIEGSPFTFNPYIYALGNRSKTAKTLCANVHVSFESEKISARAQISFCIRERERSLSFEGVSQSMITMAGTAQNK
jgi:RHS repeat-associated protein